MFTVYQNTDSDATLIPNLFIDKYMKDANDAQIKVYLYIVRMMNARRATSLSEMADCFNHTEKEVLRSLRYWEKKGVLTLDFSADGILSGIHLNELKSTADETSVPLVISSRNAEGETDTTLSFTEQAKKPSSRAKSAKASAAGAAASRTAGSVETAEAVEAFRKDKDRAQLLFIVEQYIGKPLSVSEIESLYYISENLKFSDDLIDYLIQYCVDRGKKDFRYIEKVAVNWAENGISTPKQAQRTISRTKTAKPGRSSSNSFAHIMQHNYDFEELEKKLLNS